MSDFIAQWMIRIDYKKTKQKTKAKKTTKQTEGQTGNEKNPHLFNYDRSYKMRLYRLYILAVL